MTFMIIVSARYMVHNIGHTVIEFVTMQQKKSSPIKTVLFFVLHNSKVSLPLRELENPYSIAQGHFLQVIYFLQIFTLLITD